MRLDKFLKVSRLIKRRTAAKEASDSQMISVNGKIAKPSTNVEAGDIITINYPAKPLKARVLSVQNSAGKEAAKSMTEIIE